MTESKHPYTFVYQTTCEANNKSYIGVHTTSNLNDGYIGCGIFKPSDAHRSKLLLHRAVRKYGYTSFKRYILSFYDTYKEAMNEEKYIVDKLWVKSNENYNTALGGNGGMIYGLSEEEKIIIYKKVSESNTGKKRTKEFCEHLSKVKRGVPLSMKHRAALSQKNARYWQGKKRSPESIEKTATAKRGKPLSVELRKKMSKAKKGKEYSNNQRAILVFDLNNIFIKEYQSARAAGRELNILFTSIQNNMAGRTKVCKNKYIFKYKEEVFNG